MVTESGEGFDVEEAGLKEGEHDYIDQNVQLLTVRATVVPIKFDDTEVYTDYELQMDRNVRGELCALMNELDNKRLLEAGDVIRINASISCDNLFFHNRAEGRLGYVVCRSHFHADINR